ncbi:MAG: DUF177 domain-containing protein [Cytophagales bacterium]|nr:DUF177 domain-containing protein [Bernardetiaceae bacterium]MDW8203872.1 DUF177 domain-containing protein [Cytophagales bacterium]
MKAFKPYDIDILALKEKTHRYEYVIDETFFALFEGRLVERGTCKVVLHVEKSLNVLTFHFNISGTLELTCDRSLEPFTDPIALQERIFYKFGEEAKELTEDVMIIPHGTTTINVAHHIYDFISLAIPMKKLHPRFRNEEALLADDNQETLLIYSSPFSEEENQQSTADDTVEEQWKWILREKFKNSE